MDAPDGNPQDDSIAELVGRLIDEGRDVARAEVAVYKAIARRRAVMAKKGMVALVAATVLGWFAVTALVLGLVFGLATLIGPLAAGLAIAALLGVGAFVLLRFGLARMAALSGDEEERQALARGDTIS